MARELKIGIAVIGVLLVVFCGLLAKRLTRPSKLPLSSTSSKNSANQDAATAKPATPIVRPTLITSKSESVPAQNGGYWSPSTPAPNPSDSDLAASKSAQPGLLTAPLPIQDLDAKQPSEPETALPHQTGYAGADSTQDATAPAAAEGQHAPSDPFQYQPSMSKQVTSSARAVQPDRYSDYRATNPSALPPASNAPYGNYQTAAPPPASTTSNYDNTTPAAPTNPSNRYSTGSFDAGSTSRTNQSSVAAESYGSRQAVGAYADSSTQANSYPTNSYAAPADSQWSTATPVSNVQPAKPIERNGETYSVQPNDTFWTICERAYGTGAFFKALYEYNRRRHKQADELVVGQELLVPDENVLRRHYPDLCPRPRKNIASTEQRLISASTKLRGNGRVYKVVEGDTLYDVAKFELGKASRWAEIYELNRDVLGEDFDYLRPGTELILPADAPRGDSMTRQPDQTAPANVGRY